MTAALVALFLPDGRVIALAPDALRAALAAGAALGLAPASPLAAAASAAAERWLNSEELGELVGLHSTTVEGMARRGEIPSIRAGKALRFELAAVKAALILKQKSQ